MWLGGILTQVLLLVEVVLVGDLAELLHLVVQEGALLGRDLREHVKMEW